MHGFRSQLSLGCATISSCAGVGTELIRAAELWAVENGLRRLQLLADKANSPALRFYESAGWQTTSLVGLRKVL